MPDIDDEEDDEDIAEIGMRKGMTIEDARIEIMNYASKLEPREIRLLKSFYPKELHGFINQAARQKSRAQREYEKTHQDVDTLETILETKEQHGQLQNKVDELTENLNAMRSKFDETSDMLKSLIVEHESLKSSSEKDKETIESLNAHVADLTGKVADLEKSVETKDTDIATKDKELMSNDDIIKGKDEELQNKSSQITGLEAEKDRLALQLDEVSDQVAKKDELISTTEGELTTLRDEIATLQNALKEKDIRLQSLDYEYFKDMRKRKAEEIDKFSE